MQVPGPKSNPRMDEDEDDYNDDDDGEEDGGKQECRCVVE